MSAQGVRGREGRHCGRDAAVPPSPAQYVRGEVLSILTSTHGSSAGFRLSQAAAVHSLGVCLIRWESIMGRGKGRDTATKTGGLPKFVDVKLDATQRAAFTQFTFTDAEICTWLESFLMDGYRVGLSWASEQQAVFCSLTGRETGTPNDGLCMTSFAKDARSAIALAFFKHTQVCDGVWVTAAEMATGTFG